jgi:predicted deacylase
MSGKRPNSTRYLTCHPAELRHATVQQSLEELRALRLAGMQLVEVGKSLEGRVIRSAQLGSGPVRVFAWSQMHGNEATHTAVLLEIIHLLQTQPDCEVCRTILSGCTLYLVPMLNPDGAERFVRRNAQDLDVNRDALHLQTPEGRLLRSLVEKYRPDFAFNLHNQNARSSIDGKHPAAVALLVPPVDAEDTRTAWTIRAKQVAAAFLEAVRADCVGMICRYNADFMSRCFGEWVQQQGAATLTVEAGGWSTVAAEPLTEVHLAGMLSALESIASGSYAKHDPTEYDALPRSTDQELCDVLIQTTVVAGRREAESFTADVGINFAYSGHGQGFELGGRIVDLGDLRVTTGKRIVAGNGCACLPGRIAYDPAVTPLELLSKEQAAYCLSRGITTLVGRVDLADSASMRAFLELSRRQDWPLNVGFVGVGDPAEKAESAELHNLLIQSLAGGLLGCIADAGSKAAKITRLFGLPVFAASELPKVSDWPHGLSTLRQHVQETAGLLRLGGRGTLNLGSIADLVLVSQIAAPGMGSHALQHVLVGGRVVWEYGKLVVSGSGELVLSPFTAGRSH